MQPLSFGLPSREGCEHAIEMHSIGSRLRGYLPAYGQASFERIGSKHRSIEVVHHRVRGLRGGMPETYEDAALPGLRESVQAVR